MKYLTSKDWWECAGIRAIKTISQCFIASVGTALVMESVDWKATISASVLAGIISLMTSLSGLPEIVDNDGEVG